MKCKTRFMRLLLLLLVFTFSAAIVFSQNCGDINADGLADIIDALLVAQCYVGLTSCPPADVGDVNCDGVIDILDALLIAQLYVGLINTLNCCGTPGPTPGDVTLEMQAEDATWSSGDVETDHTGYSGSGYVNTPNSEGEWIEWTVEVDRDCTASCVFTYAVSGSGRSMDLSVNGNVQASLSFADTGAWTTWETDTGAIVLSTGTNAIRLTATNSGGAPNMDKMDITILGGGTPEPTETPGPTETPEPTEPGATPTPTPVTNNEKPRIIITQDGEGDDKDSMVRFLMYSCDYDVVGIVENNSQFQPRGHSSQKWIQAKIDAYAEVLSNLRVHNPDYPDPDYLKSVIKLGNENPDDLWVAPPDMETQDTPGSQLIIDTVLDSDPRPVHITAWGGANTFAFAMWRLKTSYSSSEYEYGISRLWFYSISYASKPQDGGNEWLLNNMPEVRHFQSSWWSRTWNYSSTGSDSYSPPEVQAYMRSSWLNENVKGHGALGEVYGQDYVSEGDTPSFLPVVNNGLLQYQDLTVGGWGGRPVYQTQNYMVDGVEDPSESSYRVYAKAFYRWIPDAQNDFEARMDWCVATSYNGANHQPVAGIAGSYDVVPGGLGRNVSPGQTITLDASPSTDPDGDNLSYEWWQYFECDSVDAEISINNSTSMNNASFTVPNESGKQLHIILTVRDNGSPSLAGYKRIIFDIQ